LITSDGAYGGDDTKVSELSGSDVLDALRKALEIVTGER